MTDHAKRICSLLPSATEIVCALGLKDRLVGVTHECDYPLSVARLPRVTSSAIDSAHLTSRQIDDAVRESLEEQATIYHLDRDLLDSLAPDLILTQELCDVCAVGPAEVKSVVRSLSREPRVISLEPSNLDGVLESIGLVGRLAGVEDRALHLVDELRRRLDAVRVAVAGRVARKVLSLEWLDPVFVGGHWVPEMIEIAGGKDCLGVAGQPSRQASWDEVACMRPEIAVCMLCGFDLDRSLEEVCGTALPDAWHELPAIRSGNVYVTDGSAYFSRPGPRLIEGVEILASILHPDVFDRTPASSFARSEAPAVTPG
ncbi:MAG: cobalamin-binding protein [Chloroflexota bacterium]|nr:MAG: cobalamin-binding protein [Chloroflexota bacterium]